MVLPLAVVLRCTNIKRCPCGPLPSCAARTASMNVPWSSRWHTLRMSIPTASRWLKPRRDTTEGEMYWMVANRVGGPRASLPSMVTRQCANMSSLLASRHSNMRLVSSNSEVPVVPSSASPLVRAPGRSSATHCTGGGASVGPSVCAAPKSGGASPAGIRIGSVSRSRVPFCRPDWISSSPPMARARPSATYSAKPVPPP